ncbi:MAG TPA: WD40 repeat domain-containing protein [Candidatus Lokiarchaeia archaeon]|nr:WD40 repeat domain-containing protein [Candidatus Lokiarchaeia archaeon]
MTNSIAIKFQQVWVRSFKKAVYSCSIANLVGNSKPEVIACSFGEMRAFDLKGNEMLTTKFSPKITTLKIASITTKDAIELVSGDTDGFIHVVDMNGDQLWTTNLKSPVICMDVGNLVGDDRNEIVAGLENTALTVLGNDGSIALQFSATEPVVDCAIARLQNAPDARIAVLLKSGKVVYIDVDGNITPGFDLEERGTSIAFIEFRSQPFIIVGDRNGVIRIFTPDGEIVGKNELGEKINCIDGFAMSGTETSDFLVATASNANLYLFKLVADKFPEGPVEKDAGYVRRKSMKESQALIEQQAVTKIQKMMKVSKRIRIDMMREALGMDMKSFSDKMIDWAAQFNFSIDGDYVDFENADTDGFLTTLDGYFTDWNQNAKTKKGKI